jgi:hypothetical protein
MKKHWILLSTVVLVVLVMGVSWTLEEGIPKTWDLTAIKKFHLPPPDSTVTVTYASEEYYYNLPEHVIYRSFPVYAREFEKKGYIDSLRQLEPEIVFDPSKLKTQEDWIRAGELVFNWPAVFRPANEKVAVLTAKQFEQSTGRLTATGEYLANRYILTDTGKLLLGSLSCAACHTRILESGKIVPGAQGNVTDVTRFANTVESGRIPFPVLQQGTVQLFHTPWAPAEIRNHPDSASELVRTLLAAPAGVSDRQGTMYQYPVSIPSLIGVRDIKYLDHSGLMKHEGPGDMMRYAAFNQGMDMLTSYNGYIPGGKNKDTELPVSAEWNHPFGYAGKRYSDAQLYALTQYIYSLQPPKNPNKFPKELITKGEKVFAKAGCVTCHTPPLYTNNKLTPANGFEPPKGDYAKYDIFNLSVETDSVSALYSRRGTGYYKVPSLRGVWYRGVFFHNGNLTTLEEVLDPRRVEPGYVPSGFIPPHKKTLSVKGHPFGFDLSESDKKALLAFLKTL